MWWKNPGIVWTGKDFKDAWMALTRSGCWGPHPSCLEHFQRGDGTADFERAHRDYNSRQDCTSEKIPLLSLSQTFGSHLGSARVMLFIQTWTEDVLQERNSWWLRGHHSVKDLKSSVPTASHHRTKILFVSHLLLLLAWIFFIQSVVKLENRSLETWDNFILGNIKKLEQIQTNNLLLLALLWAGATNQSPPEVLSSLNYSVLPLLVSHIKYILSEKACTQFLNDVSQNFLSNTRQTCRISSSSYHPWYAYVGVENRFRMFN